MTKALTPVGVANLLQRTLRSLYSEEGAKQKLGEIFELLEDGLMARTADAESGDAKGRADADFLDGIYDHLMEEIIDAATDEPTTSRRSQ